MSRKAKPASVGTESHGSSIIKTAGPPKETSTAVPGFFNYGTGFHPEFAPGQSGGRYENLENCFSSRANGLPTNCLLCGTFGSL